MENPSILFPYFISKSVTDWGKYYPSPVLVQKRVLGNHWTAILKNLFKIKFHDSVNGNQKIFYLK